MAKKKNTFGKFLAFTTAVAAIVGACYIFRDKIKQSSFYKASASKLTDIYDKVCSQEDEDFFFDDEEEKVEEVFSGDSKKGREYTSITNNVKEETDTVDYAPDSSTDQKSVNFEDTTEISSDDKIESSDVSPVTEIQRQDASTETDSSTNNTDNDVKEIFSDESIPTITFDSSNQRTEEDITDINSSQADTEEVAGYEYEGLSDVSEDPEVLEEEDKLDF